MDRPKVSSVAVELTAYCNQKCDYCYNPWREDGGAEIGAPKAQTLLARVDKIIDQLDIDHFTLTGGEPFAHHDVFTLIERIRSRGCKVQMISNGGLIDDDIAARLVPFALSYVQITLNGPDAALHGEHVGPGEHFEKTIEGIKALRRHGVPVVGCIVITKKNAHRVGDILALWNSLGVRQISLSRFSPAGYAASLAAQLLCTRDELTTAFEQALPYAKEGMRLVVTMPIPPCSVEVERFKELQFGTCAVGTTMQEFALGPDGRLKNCTLHSTAIGGVDDILDPSVNLAQLIQAKEVTEYKKKIPEFCEGCLHANTCAGGCGAAAEWISGDARAFPDPFVWQHVDDELAARFDAARNPKRRDGRTHLEVIL
jgi:radical SAM protein with 4Fe4S-binding SPASM domain